jgi:hypothetical protein
MMNTNSPVYAQLNKAWKATCRVLFGEEIGELKDYEEWLKEYIPVVGKRKSHVSGKDVTVTLDDYCKDARFVSLDEVKEKSIEPLTINEIKDIDTLVEAISEKWEYCGNRVLGKSLFVESSDAVIDSNYVMDSFGIGNSSHIFGSATVRSNCKMCFGSVAFSIGSEFLIKTVGGTNTKRAFESYYVEDCSDMFFSHNCINCNNLMFSFHQRNKRYMIGNLQLTQGKYIPLKKKLLEEIKARLKQARRFPSLAEIVSASYERADVRMSESKEEITDMKPIEKAFTTSFKILFKKDIEGVDRYEQWLTRYSPPPFEFVSPFSGKKIYFKPYLEASKFHSSVPLERVVPLNEAQEVGSLHLNENEIGSFESIEKNIGRIGYFCFEIHKGTFRNVTKSPVIIDSANSYKNGVANNVEYAALNVAVGPNSKFVFGNNRITDSQFCLNCHYSSGLNRCFEIDSSTNCSDSYFAHNCEGLNEAMFCWNAKGKRYAIGNLQLPPEQYRKIKDMFVEQMADEILSKNELRYDIFNVGCGKK